ncbi:MAG: UDP-N-acetylmuramate dehydrogenase [Gammaproteobacteria bacterium]|nr:UDP-N-acetylmuramate dehydrogenase [Gammaproteobacteria bacterium]
MRVQTNASLQSSNSFGFESIVDEFVIVRDVDELEKALDTTEPITVLGEGTNVVLKPRIEGRVIKLAIDELSVLRIENDDVLVTVGAGVNWHELVRFSLGRGISGLENLALIPGSVGAAPFQNIGAYGVELDQVCEGVRVYDRDRKKVRTLSVGACDFTYRNSVFKSTSRDRFVICGLTLRLGDRELATHYRDVDTHVSTRSNARLTATAVAEIVIRIRRNKLPDPRKIGNVGSFFKNPILSKAGFDDLSAKLRIEGHHESGGLKISAARLIDEAGWKGVQHDGAEVWPRQPLVLVNRGSATARSVLELASRIADDVHRRFAVELELEPEVLGIF